MEPCSHTLHRFGVSLLFRAEPAGDDDGDGHGHGDGDRHEGPSGPSENLSDPDAPPDESSIFSSVPAAMWQLLILVTTANFPGQDEGLRA